VLCEGWPAPARLETCIENWAVPQMRIGWLVRSVASEVDGRIRHVGFVLLTRKGAIGCHIILEQVQDPSFSLAIAELKSVIVRRRPELIEREVNLCVIICFLADQMSVVSAP